MHLKKTLIIAIVIALAGLSSWEMYWRSEGYYPTIDDDKALWAVERAKIKTSSKNDVVLLGSSRVLFDMQKNEWEMEIGKRPIQLATAGATPLPLFTDIVDNTDFDGTVIIGVTPGLFFSTTYPLADPWKRAESRVDHYHDRTYAQILNHILSLPLQKTLVFLISFEEKGYADGINLKELLTRVKIGNRLGEGIPPFHDFSDIAEDRNTEMRERTVTDTTFSNSIKRVWAFYGKQGQQHPPEKNATMAYFLKDAKKFIDRGGNLILLRCPSTGGARIGESHGLPRTDYWDVLVQKTGVKAYHFEDYKQLRGFDCPEWSHLSATDAALFTTEFARILKNDDAFTIHKIN